MNNQNKVNEADQIALMAYDLKVIRGMLKCHQDYDRDNSMIHYAYDKVNEVIIKLEGEQSWN